MTVARKRVRPERSSKEPVKRKFYPSDDSDIAEAEEGRDNSEANIEEGEGESSDDSQLGGGKADEMNSIIMQEDSEDEVERERLENKKRREAARQYLQNLQSSATLGGRLATQDQESDSGGELIGGTEVDAAQIDRETIAARLKQDLQQARGKIFRRVGEEYSGLEPIQTRILKAGDHHTPTCIQFSPDGKFLYAGFKSGDIIQWDVKTNLKIHTFMRDNQKRKVVKEAKGHLSHVLCLATSVDGSFLISGGKDKLIHVWNTQTKELVKTFTSHRGSVTGLAFQMGAMTLFSVSTDRTVKIWNIEELAYVDTLFGHQDEIASVDALTQERCLTVGMRDRTVRLWKVPEESQLVFRGLENAGGSIDVGVLIDNEHFATGSDTGALSIWGLYKKKPLVTEHQAHTQAITALYSFRLTDLLVTGSNDGLVKLWSVDTEGYRSVKQISTFKVEGCINGAVLSEDGHNLALAVGRDHRLGRWSVHKNVKNHILLITLK